MKNPPKPVPGNKPLGIPHRVSDVSAVGNCRIPFTEPAKSAFEFEVIRWEDDEITLKKLIVVESDNIKNAYDYMIENYPKPYYFKLNLPEQ